MGFTWTYPGSVDRIVDGDTIVCHVELSPRIKMHEEHVRLAGVNAPELNSPDPVVREAAQDARAFVQMLLPTGTRITLRAHGLEKYGRMLATVLRQSDGLDISAELLSHNHAIPT